MQATGAELVLASHDHDDERFTSQYADDDRDDITGANMKDNTSSSSRLFFALWPDDATRTALTQLQTSMHGRKVSYNNFHLTLAFLGQQAAAILPAAKEILAHLAASDILITLDKLGYFSRNHIAWVGPHETPEALLALYQDLCTELKKHGIGYTASSSFKAHVTLARDASLPPDVVFDPIDWRADEVALVQSITGAGGSEYRVLASRSLGEVLRVPGEVIGEQISGGAR
ncbi:RNA 2',3'-cyclic phosphodiesterase [Noviherbaspirillum saxi]|uniref:RNA 2',3'-cyclic phosphodiesterase n=1 Tax=Noviherbaspirillum saxi TaxID=2320863 RepID=A0A3A3FR04_9BURK|nr:RNA 2',3'-cyclic phosphodiesterase [Noviherbaspirillum saxi]RJF97910.1 RNA 2',3'-cyclic phosphodiesterase [Noviherbaspirillum saxi]